MIDRKSQIAVKTLGIFPGQKIAHEVAQEIARLKSLKSKKERIDDFVGKLTELSQVLDEQPFEFSANTTFVISNEFNFHDTVEYLATQHKDVFPHDKIRVAVLVGESNFPSMLPELAKFADAVIFVDINPIILQANLHQLQCLKTTPNINTFLDRCLDKKTNPFLTNQVSAKGYSRYQLDGSTVLENAKSAVIDGPLLKTVMFDYLSKGFKPPIDGKVSKYVYLGDESRFAACAQGAHKLHFGCLRMNLFNGEHARRFGALLNCSNAVVTLCNVSNLFYLEGKTPFDPRHADPSWASKGALVDCMQQFIDPQKTLILHSLFEEFGSQKLVSHHATGLVNYVGEVTRNIKMHKENMAAQKSKVSSSTSSTSGPQPRK